MKKINRQLKEKISRPINREIIKPVEQFGKKLIYGSNDYPPYVKQIINSHGNEIIQSISIKRSPVNDLVTGAMDIFTFGKFGQRYKKNFDELFHLYIEITTTLGTKILIEKNERINMELNPNDRPNTEMIQISNIPSGITINQLLQNAKNRMGSQYFQYDAMNNNCQDYILNILQANGIGNQTDYQWIKQDTDILFKGMPVLKKVSHGLTELAERGNILFSGGGSITRALPPDRFSPELVETIKRLKSHR